MGKHYRCVIFDVSMLMFIIETYICLTAGRLLQTPSRCLM
jgi:hypothetical protein